MAAATPIGIEIAEEDIARLEAACTAVANNNGVPMKRLLKRSSGHLALVVDSQVVARVSAQSESARVAAGFARQQSPLELVRTFPGFSPGRSGKTRLWLLAVTAVVVTGTLIVSLPTIPNAVAGLSIRQLASIEVIVFLSGVMSGLSGFGFSAIGSVSLLLLAPILQVPLFQALSTGNQAQRVDLRHNDVRLDDGAMLRLRQTAQPCPHDDRRPGKSGEATHHTPEEADHSAAHRTVETAQLEASGPEQRIDGIQEQQRPE